MQFFANYRITLTAHIARGYINLFNLILVGDQLDLCPHGWGSPVESNDVHTPKYIHHDEYVGYVVIDLHD